MTAYVYEYISNIFRRNFSHMLKYMSITSLGGTYNSETYNCIICSNDNERADEIFQLAFAF